MNILGIDPGETESGIVRMWEHGKVEGEILSNGEVLGAIPRHLSASWVVACEQMLPRGMPFSEQAMATLEWSGRFHQVAFTAGLAFDYVSRDSVKIHICGVKNAKDPNVRRALLDMFPRTGGGKEPAVGIKKQPGPLYGMSKHMWAALGVAITWRDTRCG